jgi:hypothetical protein
MRALVDNADAVLFVPMAGKGMPSRGCDRQDASGSTTERRELAFSTGR